MAGVVLTLSAHDPDPAVRCDRGISLVPASERQQHAPGATLLLVDDGSLTARCGCWWTGTAVHDGRRPGVIGHYAAADAESGRLLLTRACERLAAEGASAVVGPMDGTTWRRYRFIVDRGTMRPFFLEPDHPGDWPAHWIRAGFTPFAAYTSAVNENLPVEDPRTAATLDRLHQTGITIRPFDATRPVEELRSIFRLSLAAFERNLLYTPIPQEEFVAHYRALLPHIRPELVLLAERRRRIGTEARLVGFVFAVPDLLQARGGGMVDTVVVKTVAVDTAVGGMGVGGALVDLVQRQAAALGYRRAIHALMHEANRSRSISDRCARTIRRYALYSRPLV